MNDIAAAAWPLDPPTADLERRFGGLRRLYGARAYEKIRHARMAIVGLGGVGSWVAEALARSGVAELVLVDLDHVAESNVNRQIQALGSTLGLAKVQALKARIADIHPGCTVHDVEAFVEPGNWPQLLPVQVDVLVDACDQVQAKLALAAWGLQADVAVVCVGAAGGKRQPQRVEVTGLAEVTHDPLLASLRQRLRKQMRTADATPDLASKDLNQLRCVFSREPVAPPAADCELPGTPDGSLNCHGYGSSVTVTATFGLVAAAEALAFVTQTAQA